MATKAPRRNSSNSDSEAPDEFAPDFAPDTTPSAYTHDPRGGFPVDSEPSPNTHDPRSPAPTDSAEPASQRFSPQKSPYDAESPASREALRGAESDASSLYNPNPNGSEDSKPADDADLSEAENGDDGYYNPDAQGPRFAKQKVYAKKHKKGMIIGGSFLGGGLVGIFVSIIMLVPLKIEHIVNNFEQRFTSGLTSAAIDANTKMLNKYLEKHVLSSYKNCGNIVDKTCDINIIGPGNPVRNMYKSWAKVRLEKQLSAKGIDLQFEPKNGPEGMWRMFGPGLPSEGKLIGPNGHGISGELKSSKALKNAYSETLQDATKWEEVLYRYKVGRLATQLHGTKRCIGYCGHKDWVERKSNKAKQAAKIYLAERVLKPRSDLTYLAVTCIITVSCDPNTVDASPCEEGVDCTAGGAPQSDPDRAQRQTLSELANEFGINDAARLAQLDELYTDMNDRGFKNYAIEEVLQKVFNVSEVASKRATSAIPYLGWVNLAAEIVNGVNGAGPKIKKLSYMINAAAAVQLYMNYRTYADEIHTGKVGPTEAGSWVDSLGTTTDTPENPSKGGTGSAEDSPLYQNLISSNGSSTQVSTSQSILSAVLPQKAYAATSASTAQSTDKIKCDNGEPVPKGKLVCSEEELGQGSGILNSIHDYLAKPENNLIVKIAEAWRDSIGKLMGLVDVASGWFIEKTGLGALLEKGIESACGKQTEVLGITVYNIDLPPFTPIAIIAHPLCAVKGLIDDKAPAIAEGAVNRVIQNPFSTNMSGGRTVDMVAAGANVVGNESCDAAGCQAVSDAKMVKIMQEYLDGQREDFESRSFYARMFDTDSQYSLVSRVAMATPIDVQASTQTGFANLLSNPMGPFIRGFGSLFSSKKAGAAEITTPDVFKIGNRAFPTEKIPDDPEEYWDTHNCGDTSENGPIAIWQKKSADAANADKEGKNGGTNPDTGQPLHDDVEPCLLIKYMSGVSGGYIDPSLLSKDDLAETTLVDGGTTGKAGSDVQPATAASGDVKELAKQILANPNVDLSSFNRSVLEDVQNAANGQNGGAGVKTSATLLRLIATLGKNHKVTLNAIQSNGQGHCQNTPKSGCPNNAHYNGNALDFGFLDGVKVTGRNAPSLTIIKTAFEILPKGSSFGQVQCGPTPTLPAGWLPSFRDECHHLHLQVPKGTP